MSVPSDTSALVARGVLLDIEGTTSSISFVYDVMFPFVRRELDAYLQAQWGSAPLAEACDAMARDAGFASGGEWLDDLPADEAIGRVAAETLRLMDGDVKATGLKMLQGLIWRSGFESGELRAHVYDDVPAALGAWHRRGLDVRVYSSGSIAAQKLFFGHTIAGDLLEFFHGHYDTTSGSKREPASYAGIARRFGLPPGDVVFVSDVVAELDAAREAGMQTILCARPGNPDPGPHAHGIAGTLGEIVIATSAERGAES